MKRILLFLIAALMYSMNAFTQTTFIDDTQVKSSISFSISCYMGFENYHDAYMSNFMDAVGHFNTDVLHSLEYPIWCSGYPETRRIKIYRSQLTQEERLYNHYEAIPGDYNYVIAYRVVVEVKCKHIDFPPGVTAENILDTFCDYSIGYMKNSCSAELFKVLKIYEDNLPTDKK